MDEIRNLYNFMLQERAADDEISRNMKDEILALLADEEKRLTSQEYDQYRDKVFQAASIAEEGGFVRGFRFAFHLFVECMQE